MTSKAEAIGHHSHYPREGTYADLLAWHLEYWGTRPSGDTSTNGTPWDEDEFRLTAFAPSAPAQDAARSNLNNWLAKGKNPRKPKSAPNDHNHSMVAKALFGDPPSPQFSEWRADLEMARQRSTLGRNKRTRFFPEPPRPHLASQSETQLVESQPDLKSKRLWIERLRTRFTPKGAALAGAVILASAVGLGAYQYLIDSSSSAPESAPIPADADMYAIGPDGSLIPIWSDESETSGANGAEAIDLQDTLTLVSNGTNLRPLSRANIDPQLMESFIEWVRPEVVRLSAGYDTPVIVETTLPIALQHAASLAVRDVLPVGVEGMLVSMDRDGAVLALMGGANVAEGQGPVVNPVFEAGSAWRIFVYSTALQVGFTPEEILSDVPVTIEGWQVPQRRYAGGIDLREAFSRASNSITMQLAVNTGHDAIEAEARRYGISTPISQEVSMPLGTSNVRMDEMTHAFAILSAGGLAVEPYGVTKISTLNGEVIYQRAAARPETVVSERVTNDMIDLLQTSAAHGAARSADFGRPLAGLAGTSPNSRSGWFFGFSQGITTGVWMGRPDGHPSNLRAGELPARAFAAFMRAATAGRPNEGFPSDLTLPDRQ